MSFTRTSSPPSQHRPWNVAADLSRSGLASHHQYVVDQGYPPEEVEAGITQSVKDLVAAGYNIASESRIAFPIVHQLVGD